MWKKRRGESGVGGVGVQLYVCIRYGCACGSRDLSADETAAIPSPSFSNLLTTMPTQPPPDSTLSSIYQLRLMFLQVATEAANTHSGRQ